MRWGLAGLLLFAAGGAAGWFARGERGVDSAPYEADRTYEPVRDASDARTTNAPGTEPASFAPPAGPGGTPEAAPGALLVGSFSTVDARIRSRLASEYRLLTGEAMPADYFELALSRIRESIEWWPKGTARQFAERE